MWKPLRDMTGRELRVRDGVVDHIARGIHGNWVVLGGQNEKEHHSKENDGEEQKLVDKLLLVLQVHEDEGHERALHRRDEQTQREVSSAVVEVKHGEKGGGYGQHGASEEDGPDFHVGLDVSIPIMVVMTMSVGMCCGG